MNQLRKKKVVLRVEYDVYFMTDEQYEEACLKLREELEHKLRPYAVDLRFVATPKGVRRLAK